MFHIYLALCGDATLWLSRVAGDEHPLVVVDCSVLLAASFSEPYGRLCLTLPFYPASAAQC